MQNVKRLNLPDNNFNLLRLAAVLSVVYSHYLRIFDIGTDSFLKLTNNHTDTSTLGVISFFVISGFLVTRSLLLSENRFHFLYNRVLRIFPGHILCLLVSIFLIGLFSTQYSLIEYMKSPQTYFYFLNVFLYSFQYKLPGVFEYNPHQYAINASIWTLWIEFTLYIILFICYKNRIFLFYIVLGTLFICSAVFFSHEGKLLFVDQIHFYFGDVFVYFLNISGFCRFALFFFMGSVFALIDDRFFKNIWIFLLLFITYLYFISMDSNLYRVAEYISLPYIVIYFGMKNFISINKILSKVGDLSYGIYLYHYPVGQFVWKLTNEQTSIPKAVIISLLVTLMMAYLSWRYVEKPFLKLKKYTSLKGHTPAAYPQPSSFKLANNLLMKTG